MRRGVAWSALALGCMAVSVALIGATAAVTPAAQPGLATGPSWRATQDQPGVALRGPSADDAWLSLGSVPGAGTRWQAMSRAALLDLHQLSRSNGAVAAGAAGRWNYAWPRDCAFVAVALARAGHQGEALRTLAFLQRVQRGDGGFEARYLLDGSGTPDDRARQSDSAGWVSWAIWEVSRSGRDMATSATAAPLRSLLDRATDFALAATDDGRRLPPASPDYWEVGVSRTSLGTVAPLLAGLEASQKMYAALGEPALARRSGAAATRLRTTVSDRFAAGWNRFGSGGRRDGGGLPDDGRLPGGGGMPAGWGLRDDGGLDAAVTFLMPPFAQSPLPQVAQAWTRYQYDALRPAGGLAPGSQWKHDGISWTPETALVGYTAAMSGRRDIATHWMDWLGEHRTPWGSLPEKVLASGAPAGPAPIAWTAALVILTAAELESPGR